MLPEPAMHAKVHYHGFVRHANWLSQPMQPMPGGDLGELTINKLPADGALNQ